MHNTGSLVENSPVARTPTDSEQPTMYRVCDVPVPKITTNYTEACGGLKGHLSTPPILSCPAAICRA